MIINFSPSSELAARLQEAENAAAEEERQEGEGEGGHGQAQGQAIGPRSNRDKKVKLIGESKVHALPLGFAGRT